MEWSDEFRRLRVRANADNPSDAAAALKFGAEGIGLCRTEHMFFDSSRIKAMREMIVAKNTPDREKALLKLLPYQQSDFEGLFEVMGERPVTIRFLDPPLHEFLPTKEEDIKEIAGELNITVQDLRNVIDSLHEFNPMMGHRGCRLAVSYPEIAAMQTTAVINAAMNVSKKLGINIVPNIMIPLVGDVKELQFVKATVTQTADKIIADAHSALKYEVGTMIEIPRAALIADEIATEAEFFSFGTNDLTQMTFGFSRDDAAKFLQFYYESRVYESDPFAHLDQNGVGKLVEMATTLGRKTRPNLH
ncbi:MAG: putative PEP-binding protein, partial [Clostridia bacterium]